MIASLVAGAVATGIVVAGTGRDDRQPPPAPGPAARTVLAEGPGAALSAGELSALIAAQEQRPAGKAGGHLPWAVLGSAYLAQGALLGDRTDFGRAERALRRSLEALPGEKGNADAQVAMAALANARRDFASARRWAESVRARSPEQWTAYPALIDAYSGLGSYAAAAKALHTLEELRPRTVQTLLRGSQVHRDNGRYEDAEALADEAVSRSGGGTERARALYRLGELAWERGEPGRAAAYFDTALRLESGHHPSLAGRGRASAALGRTDDALRDYQAAIERAPLPEYALRAGELYESLGMPGEARAHYEKVRRLAAKARKYGVSEELTLARYEADHGQADSAVRRLALEWKRGHRSAHVSDALGWALHRAGRTEEGLKYLKRATAPGLRSALSLYHRGEIERALGRDGPARRHLREALRLNPYFSPLLVPRAQRAVSVLGDPPPGGPADVEGEPWATGGDLPPEGGETAEDGERTADRDPAEDGERTADRDPAEDGERTADADERAPRDRDEDSPPGPGDSGSPRPRERDSREAGETREPREAGDAR
ncbi:tetratricopeptide repeat protein [Streptomyces pacificus]|uniref:Tetratricopeptide repeat protein n=1 Tax=Streptomyces pacificus TaxID=2705029 RepID=A0A6A0APW0_9ACTN|nr:tetratricopeptide repeat protein [Streptomyces pacificus]